MGNNWDKYASREKKITIANDRSQHAEIDRILMLFTMYTVNSQLSRMITGCTIPDETKGVEITVKMGEEVIHILNN